MILYTEPNTFNQLHLQLPKFMDTPQGVIARHITKMEAGDPMLTWGCHFLNNADLRCLQIVHYATGLSIFLVNVSPSSLNMIGELITEYVFDIYDECPLALVPLKKFFDSSPYFSFDLLSDKVLEQKMERARLECSDGLDFKNFVENGVLRTRKLNKFYNWKKISYSGKDSRYKHYMAAEAFQSILIEQFGAR